MSAIFNSTTDRIVAPVPMSAIGTIAFWIKTNWSGGNGSDYFLCDARSDPNHLSIQHFVNNNFYTGWSTDGDYRAVGGSGNYAVNSGLWTTIALTWNDTSNSTKFFVGGELVATNSTLVTTAITGITLGNLDSAAGNENMDGKLAKFCILSREWSSTEIRLFHAGAMPSNATGRVARFNLLSSSADSWGSYTGVDSNMTYDAADSPPTLDLSGATEFSGGGGNNSLGLGM